jgi:mannosyltransferase OCH1-like enzyme
MNKFILVLIVHIVLFILWKKYHYSKFIKGKIPFVVYQTWKNKESIPPILQQTIENNKNMCPNFTFTFYSDDDCYNFIKDNFSGDVLKAYTSIHQDYSAAKADLWRYCILYKYGGVYIDIKSVIKKNLADVIKPTDSCVLLELKDNKWKGVANKETEMRNKLKYPTYEQWALIFEAGHPYLKQTINDIVNNINNNNIPKNVSSKKAIMMLTGPDAYSNAINEVGKVNDVSIIDIFEVFEYKPPGYYQELLYKNNVHYSEGKHSITSNFLS